MIARTRALSEAAPKPPGSLHLLGLSTAAAHALFLPSAQLDAKGLELDLVMEEATSRERQAQTFMKGVTEKLQKAHR